MNKLAIEKTTGTHPKMSFNQWSAYIRKKTTVKVKSKQ